MTTSTPLSPSQRRMWFAHRLEGPSATYNVPLVVTLRGRLDRDALTAAVDDLVARHESLRTSFGETAGEPWQRVHPTTEASIVRHEDATSVESAEQRIAEIGLEPFDLTTPPVRAVLLCVDPEVHVLGLVMHHLVCDGWSVEVLLRDLETAYAARAAGADPTFPELAADYAGYVSWLDELLGDAGDPDSLTSRQMAFWREELRDLPDELSLPYDRPRRPTNDLRGGRLVLPVGADLSQRLQDLGRTLGATEFMVLQAAVAAVLQTFGAGDDIPLGTATSGRGESALDDLVGVFINTQVIRCDLAGDPSFRSLVERVRGTSLSAMSHQDLPFDRIVEAVNPPRVTGRHPLFQVGVELHSSDFELRLDGVESTVTMPSPQVAKFDLSFAFVRQPAGKELELQLEHSLDLFETRTVRRLGEAVIAVLESVVADPDAPLSSLEVLTPADRARLDSWNDAPSVELHETVLASFERRAAERPDDIALVAGDVRLSFAELNAWVNRCAHGLIAEGVGPDDVVAMALPRSAEAIVTWLAIGKSGGVYAPIDPHLPPARIGALIASARPRVLVTDADLLSSLDAAALPATVTDLRREALPETDPTQEDRVVPLLLDHAAYVIFTSGSTGTPKAVTVLHRALANLWSFHTRVTFPSPSSPEEIRRVALSANLAFDTSWEGVLAMIAGHELHLLDEPTRRDPRATVAYVREHGIDQLDVTPSLGAQLFGEGLLTGDHVPSTLMFGGEAVSEALWSEARAARRTRFFNYYGPSEFCIEASGCALAESETSTIGRPVSHTQVLVLDDHLRRVPPGVVGELYLAGANLGRGYLGQAARTAERFVANPYGAPGSRMYRSGDLAKWTEDGFLVFRGRSDDQVKLRGFRIELEEIQRVIESHDSVVEAAVVLREDASGEKRIAAYVVSTGDDLDASALRAHLEDRFPDYMVPAAFVAMAELPLNRNAKLDRKALPEPVYEDLTGAGSAPTTEREIAVAALFAEVLRVDSVGLDDNFFELGGHSLLATRLINQVRTQLEVQLDLMAFFTNPSVSGIVAAISDDAPSDDRPRLVRRD